jgi:hypothetical protein
MLTRALNLMKSMLVGDLIENAKNDNLDKVRHLLQNGAAANAKDRNGRTALYFACYNCHSDVALEILKQGNVDVDVNAKNSDGQTAFIWASVWDLSNKYPIRIKLCQFALNMSRRNRNKPISGNFSEFSSKLLSKNYKDACDCPCDVKHDLKPLISIRTKTLFTVRGRVTCNTTSSQ